MKNLVKSLAVVMLVVTGLVGVASAQDTSRTRNTKIDFDFYAGKQLMSAGEYEFEIIGNSGPHKLVRVRNINNGSQALLSTIPNRNVQHLDSGSVAFNKYGDQYFLAGVQLGDLNFVHTTLKTNTERDIARHFSGKRINTQTSGQ